MSSVRSAPPSPVKLPAGEVSALTESKISTDQLAAQTLFDNFRTTLQGSKAAGILPIKVSFPQLGPSLFLVSELTGENQSPSANLNYQREKKAGGR
jgi:hypothetical protein